MRAFDNLEGDLERWIRETADGKEVTQLGKDGLPVTFKTEGDPAKAADLLVRMAEYHVPKLGRQELVGQDGAAAIQVIINKAGPKSEGP